MKGVFVMMIDELMRMKDIDQQQHLDLRDISLKKKTFDLPVSEMAETDALGGCCSK